MTTPAVDTALTPTPEALSPWTAPLVVMLIAWPLALMPMLPAPVPVTAPVVMLIWPVPAEALTPSPA